METFPSGQVTPLGVSQLQSGHEPLITYTSPDNSLVFYVNGGLAPIVGVTEGVVLEEGMDGLHPSFTHLDHKGARQDGVTWTDTVYDPAEMTMRVKCTAQTPEGLRRVMRKWIAAWDPKNPGTLSVVTPEMGEWTCKPRMAKTFQDKLERAYAQRKTQSFIWPIRNDSAFWTGPNSLSQVTIPFESAVDTFNRDGKGSLGPNWQQTYSGPGGGACGADNGKATWSAVNPDTFFTGTRTVTIGPFKDYATSTDKQSISFIPANTPVFTLGTGAANYIWGRMGRNVDGTWNGYGVRAAVGWGFTRISVFNNFVETILIQQFSLIPPLEGEVWTLNCGSDTDPYYYELVRDDYLLGIFDTKFLMCSAHDTGHVTQLGVNYRGVGFGLQAGGAILNQATPASVREISSAGVVLDTFDYTTDKGLGPNWPLYYTGTTTGYVRAASGLAEWVDTALGRTVFNRWLGANEVQTVTVYGNPGFWNLTYHGTTTSGTNQTTASIPGGASAAQVQAALQALPAIGSGNVTVTGDGGPYVITLTGALAATPMNKMTASIVSGGVNPYITVAQTTVGANHYTASDDQIISVKLGNPFSFPLPEAAYINIWGRLDTNDSAPTGILMQLGPQWITMFAVVAGVYHQIGFKPLFIAPLWNETWSLVCGSQTNVNKFTVLRDGQEIFSCTDSAGISSHGAGFRGAGFGMSAGSGQFVQDIPPAVLKWSMGDNSGVTHSDHITLTNFGDQDAYPDYVVYGPGTFTFADGPSAQPTVVFGPLTDGQVAFIRTDPGLRGVYDISTDAAETTLSGYSDYVQQLLSLTVNNNIQPLLEWFKSEFGVTPSQGNMYSLLQGRFTQPIPAMPVTGPQTQQIAVTITGATAQTRVIGVITPRRRWPL